MSDKYITIPDCSGGGSGVSDINGLTGSINLLAGTNITLTPVGQNITISSTGGGSSPWTEAAGVVSLVNPASVVEIQSSIFSANTVNKAIDANFRQLFAVDGTTLLLDFSGSPNLAAAISFTNGPMNQPVFANTIQDTSNQQTYDTNLRQFYDAAGLLSEDYNARILYSSDGSTERINYDTGQIFDETGELAITFANNNRFLLDAAGAASENYNERHLIADDGSSVAIDWSTPGQVSFGSGRITNVQDPIAAQDAATKNYVDTLSGVFLKLDQTAPEYVINGAPNFQAGITLTASYIFGSDGTTPSIDTVNRKLYDTTGAIPTVSWQTGLLTDNTNILAATWQNRTLYNYTPVPTLDWGNSQLISPPQKVLLDWSGTSTAFLGLVINDSGGTPLVGFGAGSGIPSVQFFGDKFTTSTDTVFLKPQDRQLVNSAGVTAIDWQNEQVNSGPYLAWDWSQSKFYNIVSNTLSIDYRFRQLLSYNGTDIALDWHDTETGLHIFERATPPSVPTPGGLYYDTVLNQLGYWNGSAWVYTVGASTPTLAQVLTAGRSVDATGTIQDNGAVVALDINNRTLLDPTGNILIDYTGTQNTSSGLSFAGFSAAFKFVIKDNFGLGSVATNTRQLMDSSGTGRSIDWGSRQLFANDGSSLMMQWIDVTDGLHVLESGAAPAAPTAGAVYYDTVLNELGYWDGTVWQYLSGAGTLGGTFLKLDQTVPQTVINGQPNFALGLGIQTPTPVAPLEVTGIADQVQVIVRSAVGIGQTADIMQWYDASNNIVASMPFDGGLVLNQNSQSTPAGSLQVKGNGDPNLLFTDATNDFVGIGTNTPAVKLHVAGNEIVAGYIQDTTLVNSINTNLRNTFDSLGVLSADYDVRQLMNIGGSNAIDWANMLAYDLVAIQSMNWDARTLQDNGTNDVLDWQNKVLGTTTNTALNWNSRVLVHADGTTVAYDWEASAGYDQAGKQFISGESRLLIGGDGSTSQMSWSDMTVWGPLGLTGPFVAVLVLSPDLTAANNVANISISALDLVFESTVTNGGAIFNGSGIKDITAVKSLSPNDRQLYDSNGNIQMDWSTPVNIDLSNNNFTNVGGISSNFPAPNTQSIDNYDRTLFATDGVTAVLNWATQQTATGVTAGYTAHVTANAVFDATTFTGNTGTTAYTLGDIVKALKTYGLLAS